MLQLLITLISASASAATVEALLDATGIETEALAPTLALTADGASLVETRPTALADGLPTLVPAVGSTELVRIAGLGLQPGPVDTVFVGHQPIASGGAVYLEHGGLFWTLAMPEEAPWVLELGDHPHRTEAIHAYATLPADDGEPVLLWAGDIDGDGLLDLLVDLAEDPAMSAPTLMLSTEAEGEQHVGVAARMVVRPGSRQPSTVSLQLGRVQENRAELGTRPAEDAGADS